MNTIPRVVVVGGGFAGLETIFYLRHKLRDRVDLRLISDSKYFIFKPNTIYVPFGADPNKFRIDLDEPTHRKNIEFIIDLVNDVDLNDNKVITDLAEISYDYLVIATGAAMRPDEIPGLSDHALSPWTIEDMLRLRFSLKTLKDKAEKRAGTKTSVFSPAKQQVFGPFI